MVELCCTLSPFVICTYCKEQWCPTHWLPDPHSHRVHPFGKWICPKYNQELTWEIGAKDPGLLVAP